MHGTATKAPSVWQRYWGAIQRVREKQLLALAGMAVGGAVIYFLLTALDKAFAGSHTPLGVTVAGTVLVAAATLAAMHRDARYGEIWMPLRILMRGAGAVIFAQICFDALYPSAFPSNIFAGIDTLSRLIVGFAFASGVLAMLRPAFLLPMGLAYLQFRYGVPKLFGLLTTYTDFVTINDVATYPALLLIGWRVLTRVTLRGLDFGALISTAGARLIFERLTWAICVGAHLGNYFHSGLAKMSLGMPNPFFWITVNPTGQSIAIGLDRFVAPLAAWPQAVQLYFDVLTRFAIPFNTAVCFIQLLAPLAIAHRRLLIVSTLAFDAIHLGIWFSLGPLFFFWIALNIVILVSLEAMRDSELTPALKLVVVLTSVFGILTFNTATLGWMDGKKVVREVFYANTDDGRRVLVPPATFGLYSYQVAHGDLFIPDNHFQMRMGANAERADWEDVSTCGPAILKHQDYVTLDNVRNMVAQTDAYYRRHPWVRDLQLYYFYPHHAFSNPVFFRDYVATPLEKIRSYSYVVESECIGVKDGKLDNNVKVRSEYQFDVDRT